MALRVRLFHAPQISPCCLILMLSTVHPSPPLVLPGLEWNKIGQERERLACRQK